MNKCRDDLEFRIYGNTTSSFLSQLTGNLKPIICGFINSLPKVSVSKFKKIEFRNN